MTVHSIDLDPIALTLDASVGHIAELKIRDGDQLLSPLHRAPWVDDGGTEFPDGTAPNVKRLSGDFFCAPFGRNEIEDAPSHGWPANSGWSHVETIRKGDRVTTVFRLKRPVMGAMVEKQITLIAGHPFIYQQHSLSGGSGSISAAHHVMVHMKEGGGLAFSPKQDARTPPEPLEPDPARGRSILAYPAQTNDLTAFPLAAGGFADLRWYPPGKAHEDFLTLVEKTAAGEAGVEKTGLPGWTAVSRKAEQDYVIVLKCSEVLPVTMLWMSNGGRDYAPWSGRHVGVLGIEDARASPMGHAASCADNEFTRSGVSTAFELGKGRSVTIRQVLGACAKRPGEGEVTDLSVKSDQLTLHFDHGPARQIAFDAGFLDGG